MAEIGAYINGLSAEASPDTANDMLLLRDATDGSMKKIAVGTVQGSGGDADAIHDNVAGEINAISEKTSPIDADLVIIEDSADSNNKKKVQLGNLPGNSQLELIEEIEAGVSGSATIDFTSIPATYRHLRLMGRLRGEAASDYLNVIMRFNNDSGANYDRQYLQAYSTTVEGHVVFGETSISPVTAMPGSTSVANFFSQVDVDIDQYANTNFWKTAISKTVMMQDTSSNKFRIIHIIGNWRSTSAISRITLIPSSGDFAQYSIMGLYGIK